MKNLGHAIASVFSGIHKAFSFLETYGVKILSSQEAVTAVTSLLSPKYKTLVSVGFAVLGDALVALEKTDSATSNAQSLTVTFEADVLAMIKDAAATYKAEIAAAKEQVAAVK